MLLTVLYAMPVYLVRNNINGKVYIGKTKGASASRWNSHVASARKGSPLMLHRAIRKYGAGAFTTETIATWSAKKSKAQRGSKNHQFGKRNTANLGRTLSPAWRANLSKAQKARRAREAQERGQQ